MILYSYVIDPPNTIRRAITVAWLCNLAYSSFKKKRHVWLRGLGSFGTNCIPSSWFRSWLVVALVVQLPRLAISLSLRVLQRFQIFFLIIRISCWEDRFQRSFSSYTSDRLDEAQGSNKFEESSKGIQHFGIYFGKV